MNHGNSRASHRQGLAGDAQDYTIARPREVNVGPGRKVEGADFHVSHHAGDGRPDEIAFGIAARRRHPDLLADRA